MSTCDRACAALRRRIPRRAALAISLLLVLAGGAAAAPAPLPRMPFHLSLDERIAMRDGTQLSAAVYRPAGRGPFPVIFVVTPYTADRWESWAGFFAEHGYIFACIDARGRGNSEGRFEPWINEGRDGVDAIRALARLPGSDGRVAAWGGSYSGKNQWAFAAAREPALKTIAPAATGYPGYDLGMLRNVPMPSMMRWLSYVGGRTVNANLNRDDRFWAGAYAELSTGKAGFRGFDRFVGHPSAVWHAWPAHPDFDAYWLRGTPRAGALRSIAIPVLAVTGTYDDAQLGTLRYWRQYQGGPSPKSNGYLVIGPWDHPGTRDPQLSLGGLAFAPASRLDIHSLNLQWYDWALKGGPFPQALKDHFVYYLAGAERWESAPGIAAATARRQIFYLSSPSSGAGSLAARGALDPPAPTADEDVYADDPNAAPFNEGPEGGTAARPDYLAEDAIGRRLDGDGLVYETAAFHEPADLVGQPEARLYLSANVPDFDVRVQLFEIRADGSAIFLGQDQIRARYRNDPSRAQLLKGGAAEEYRFDEFPFVARRIQAGSRLRLVICPLGASIYQQ